MAEGGGAGASGGTFELRGAAVGDVERHEALLEEFERRARARAQAVPTAVADVKVRGATAAGRRGSTHERRSRPGPARAARGGCAALPGQGCTL